MGPFNDNLDFYDYALPPPFFRLKPDPAWVGMSVIPAEGGMMEVLDQVVITMIMALTDSCGMT